MKAATVEVGMQVSKGVRMWCLAAIIILVFSIGMCAMPAHADAITVVYRGTEVLEDGQPPFNVYYINCLPAEGNVNTLVDIEISYNDGTIEKRTGEYCDTKLYIDGTLHNGVIVHDDGTHAVEVVSAISAPETPAPTPAATATIQPTPKAEATSMPTQEPEEATTRNVYLPAVMKQEK